MSSELAHGQGSGVQEKSPCQEGTKMDPVHGRPDEFFTAEQIASLSELMSKWRTARDSGTTLDSKDREELENLIREEVVASGKRSQAILTRLGMANCL
jgi:hypothetical protein